MTLKYRILPRDRITKLKELLNTVGRVRVMEVHNGLSALIANNAKLHTKDGGVDEFDALWISSLTDSAAKGHPDAEVIGIDSRLLTIQEVLHVTNKPLIVDGDTGGEAIQFEYLCSKLENLGVSAVVIEDKQYPKRNSLESGAIQNLEDPAVFVRKINRGKEACLSPDFMVIARIESFIAGVGLEDALRRAELYLLSKADGILIHSNKSSADEIEQFLEGYRKLCVTHNLFKPVACVPTSYASVSDDLLFQKGIQIVIYANHQLRAAHLAMKNVCQSVLEHHRGWESASLMSPVKEIFSEVGFLDVMEKDNKDLERKEPIILLSAGTSPVSLRYDKAMPITNILIKGKTLLQRQKTAFKEAGFTDISVVGGYECDQISQEGCHLICNAQYATTKSVHSLFLAESKMKQGFYFMFGDVLCEPNLLRSLEPIRKDIVIVVDNSINLVDKNRWKPHVDKVIVQLGDPITYRRLHGDTMAVLDIGQHVPANKATHEFIGVGKCSPRGAEILRTVYHELENTYKNQEDGDRLFADLDLNDLLSVILKKGYPIEALQVHRGWAEIRSNEHVEVMEGLL